MSKPRIRDFWDTWLELAQEGQCDSPGSAEYIRLRERWVKQGRPTPIRDFICWEANRPPQDSAEADGGTGNGGVQ